MFKNYVESPSMRKASIYFLIFFFSFFSIFNAYAFEVVTQKGSLSPDKVKKINRILKSEMNDNDIPGLAVGILKQGHLVWSKGFGWANKARKKRVTADTIFMLASISKAITFTAVLQLYEQGKINLDTSVSKYLPFKLIHPHHPETPVTMRMIMTHTTSISDDDDDELNLYSWGKDAKLPLKNLMRNYFSKDGKDYDVDYNFHKFKPGTKEEYSNMATALAGYIVERISRQPFNKYCNQKIFAPLKLKRTRWFLRELNRKDIAMPYKSNGKPWGYYTFADYPNGQLFSSVKDLARFFATIMRDGSYKGIRLLSAKTNRAMKNKPFSVSDYGLGIYYTTINGRRYLGHDGSEMGVSTEMWYNPKTGVGVIMLANFQDLDLTDALDEIAEIVR